MTMLSTVVVRRSIGDEAMDVFTTGDGGHTPLLLLGDDAARMLAWAKRASLDDGRRVYVPALPARATVPHVAHGLAAFLEDVRVPCVDIVAEGHAAAVAHVFIRAHGSRVRRLIMCGFGLPLRRRHHAEWRPLLDELRSHADAYDLDQKVARGGDVLLLEVRGEHEFTDAERKRLAAAYPGSFHEVVSGAPARFGGPAELDAAVSTFLARPELNAYPR